LIPKILLSGWPGFGTGRADEVYSILAGFFCRLGGKEFDEFQSVRKIIVRVFFFFGLAKLG